MTDYFFILLHFVVYFILFVAYNGVKGLNLGFQLNLSGFILIEKQKMLHMNKQVNENQCKTEDILRKYNDVTFTSSKLFLF